MDFTGITRKRAAEILCECFHTEYKYQRETEGYAVTDQVGREWCISRFARNTVDSLQYIRMLKEKNVAIFFEKENINTLESAGELLITILSSQAQEESRNISENVRWSLRRKYENGDFNGKRLMGYRSDEKGHMAIVPEEAEVVRFIFKQYLEGDSICAIARKLEEKGILTMRGNQKWHTGVIERMLANEK